MSQLDVGLTLVQTIWLRCGFTLALIAIRADILQDFYLHELLMAIIIHSNYHYS
jgi:hypothetical protein